MAQQAAYENTQPQLHSIQLTANASVQCVFCFFCQATEMHSRARASLQRGRADASCQEQVVARWQAPGARSGVLQHHGAELLVVNLAVAIGVDAGNDGIDIGLNPLAALLQPPRAWQPRKLGEAAKGGLGEQPRSASDTLFPGDSGVPFGAATRQKLQCSIIGSSMQDRLLQGKEGPGAALASCATCKSVKCACSRTQRFKRSPLGLFLVYVCATSPLSTLCVGVHLSCPHP
jgi:hypothetical protein